MTLAAKTQPQLVFAAPPWLKPSFSLPSLRHPGNHLDKAKV
jgi:hypothetical protein